MKKVICLLVTVVGLAACEPVRQAETPPEQPPAQKSGISVSGEVRVGVSTTF
ncbi:hypothetical protein NIT7321_01057 [Phaeobacter italicus]|uniref:Uncharacterized protein n=1 Tax=Phaeobacter italicus TaxID=481446 RepID=A0A0H5D0G5_9RHOB|nr:membrane lipoprotein lipid attachment site-containing protein [Phaeobacter italicus]CRL10213.1 hypothetical protein NIT7321_01057 [Phaeobacter italicus]